MRRAFVSLLVVSSLLLLLIITISLVHDLFTSRVAGANDFLPRWEGAVLFFQEGINPYSQEATERIQMHMYGQLARPDQDQVAFAYPFYTVLLLAPFAFFDFSYAMASAIWLVMLLVAIYLALVGVARLTELKAPAWFTLLYFICGILFYNSIRTLILGQFAAFVFVCVAGALLALRQQRDTVAGILLALSTVKPQMTVFIVIVLMLWAFVENRRQFILSFAACMGFLMLASFALLPTWLADFLGQLNSYVDYTAIGSPVWILTQYYTQLGSGVEMAMSVAVLLILIWQWARILKEGGEGERLLPLVMITLPLAELILPRTATTNQIILFLPIMWVLARSLNRGRWGYRSTAITFLAAFIAAWGLFLVTGEGRWESPIMYLFLPAIALALVAWDRFIVYRLTAAREFSSNALSG